ncbi:MAG: periplasmic component of an type molybdate transport system-like protein [Ramlibacter sp.]|jgi:molybdate transport system substrate-binding protein|nr:periplasmic component of an type molybdate transport system-like protein [Ramlibacter sp.]
MAKNLDILSGGAAQGLVGRVQADFERTHDCRIAGTFGAVGLMKEKLIAGDPCDVLILSDALIKGLVAEGRADASSVRPIGGVKTGIALKQGRQAVPVRNVDELRALLESAPAIYFPDPVKATAGIHFLKVLQALGLANDPSRLRTFPNGATAMAALAQAPEADAVGCTQVTEILITEGVQLTGLLPAPHELTTIYTAAVAKDAREPELARALIAALSAPEALQVRRACGFE